MAHKKRVRVIKKIREGPGQWRFITLRRIGNRYVWDKQPGYYYIEWWEVKKRHRALAGQTPSEAAEIQRRKTNELMGELLAGGNHAALPDQGKATAISDAIKLFMDQVRVHSPDNPKTFHRYEKVLEHFERQAYACTRPTAGGDEA